MSFRVPLLSFCLVVLSLSNWASADIIVEYEPVDNSRANRSLSGTNVSGFVTADDLTAGLGLAGKKTSGWKWIEWDSASTSFADAVAAEDVWTWGYDIDDDVRIRAESLEFKVDPNADAPDNLEIRMTVNGAKERVVFTHDFAGNNAPAEFFVDLTPFTSNAVQGDSIEFTFAGFNSQSDSGSLILQAFDGATGLRVTGSVSVPEPASIGLVAGIAGFVIVRRRRKKKIELAKADQAA